MARRMDEIDPDPKFSLSMERGRAALALGAAALGECEWDVAGDIFHVSRRMAKITGLPAGPMPSRGGEAFYDFVHPEDRDALRGRMVRGLRATGHYVEVFRMVRPDTGAVIWLECSAMVMRPKPGALRRVIGVVRDIRDQRAEADLREGLIAELDQRIKNLLDSVRALAEQTARGTGSLATFMGSFTGRLEAMASAHVLLTATRWQGAEICHIATAELGALTSGQASWDGPELLLNPRATNALTLALHELGANSVKFGALSVLAGRVKVSWKLLPDGGFALDWIEQNGPLVSPPSRRGFGVSLLERYTGRELGGHAGLEFHREGVRAYIEAGPAALAKAEAMQTKDYPTLEPVSHSGVADGPTAEVVPDNDIRGIRILIVEDAVLLALELKAGLTEAGAVVIGSAASVADAMRMLDLAFDVAVVDLDLNGQSAMPFVNELLARDVAMVLVTGLAPDIANTVTGGVSAPMVRKPYNIGQIALALTNAARHR